MGCRIGNGGKFLKVNWHDKEWEWNDLDQKLLHVNDWTNDFNLALKYLPEDKRRVVIQAGGAMGLWPYQMSKHFETVYTFEPNDGNYKCLYENVKDIANIFAFNAGIGKTTGFCTTKLPTGEQNNAGAFYTMPSTEGVPQIVLDEFADDFMIKDNIDLIQLDIEGRELEVLQGAAKLIKASSPIIMLEEKRLSQDRETGHVVGKVEQYLNNLGYKAIHKVHHDIIFKKG